LGEDCYLEESTKITGIQWEGSECKAVKVDFVLSNGLDFTERFYISEMDMDILGKGIIIGILGVEFLCKYNLVLDYESMTLHTASEDVVKVEDCDFYFGMDFGLKTLTIPLVAHVDGANMFFLVADSGADITLMTNYVMKQSNMPISDYKQDESKITTFTGSRYADCCNSTFNLLSGIIGEEGCKQFSCDDTILVLRNIDFITEAMKNDKGEDIPPISGLLSSAFMLRNKWILDFRSGIIYSRRKAA